MALEQSQQSASVVQVTNDSEVGTGAIASLAADGFPLAVGYPSAQYTAQQGYGSLYVVSSSGKVFRVQQGTGGPCAVLLNAEVTFANTLYVSSTAVANGDGSLSRPFQTIAAALAAAVANTMIVISEGTYNEALVIPQLNGLAIVGAGAGNTIIASAGATTVDFTITGAGIAKFYIADLTIRNTSATLTDRCMNLDGNAVADAASEMFRVLRVRFERTVSTAEQFLARRLNVMVMDTCDLNNQALPTQVAIIRNCSTVVMEFAAFSMLRLGYDNTNPVPALGRTGYTMTGSSSVQLTLFLEGHLVAGFAPNVGLVGATAVLAVDGTALTASAAPAQQPVLFFQNQFGNPSISGSGAIDIRIPANTASATPTIEFNQCRLNTRTGIVAGHWSIRAANGGVAVQQVPMRDAYIFFANNTSPVAGAFVIGAVGATNLNVDVRESTYSAQSVFSIPTAGPTLDRSRWNVSGNITSAGIAVSLTFPFPTGATYNVCIETPVSAGVPILTGVSAKTTSQFTGTNTSVAAITTNFTALRT